MYDSTYMRYLVKIIGTKSRMVVTRGWGKGQNGELLFNGYRVSIWEDEKVLEMTGSSLKNGKMVNCYVYFTKKKKTCKHS